MHLLRTTCLHYGLTKRQKGEPPGVHRQLTDSQSLKSLATFGPSSPRIFFWFVLSLLFYFPLPHIHSTATLREISCTACAENADGQVCVSNDFLPRFRDLFLFDVCTQLELAFWVARLGSWPLLSFPGAQSSDEFAAQVVSTSRPTPARLSSNPEVAFKSPTPTAFLFSHRSVLSLVPQE